MTVGVGQNAANGILCAFSEPDTYGRSYHNGATDTREGAVNYGYNIAEQWDRVLEIDPKIVFITGWNEWIAMRLNNFPNSFGPVQFVDCYTQEKSRDIEPMKGGHVDHYYYQMVDYIRRFKGVRKPEIAKGNITMTLADTFGRWNSVKPEYTDSIYDTTHRNHPGSQGVGTYTNITGRNDFVNMKVTSDSENIYFYAQTQAAITPYSTSNWMLLLIDSDCDATTGYLGYDFIINRTPYSSVTSVEKITSDFKFEKCGEAKYKIRGNKMQITLPRALCELYGKLSFNFKWVDNIDLSDACNLTTDGDTAPNGRFSYQYIEK